MSAGADWPAGVDEARRVQERLRPLVETADRLGPVRLAAGVDVSYPRRAERAKAAVVVLSLPGLEVVASATARVPVAFPYISGYLSFREVPAALAALQRLEARPDVVLCDGQGIAHPRRLGLASHLGVVTGLPTIGVAKSRLVGEHPPAPERPGAWAPLTHRGELVGAVLRTRAGVQPVYVSPGHRVCLETAVAITLACTTRFRLPETTRSAHRLAGSL